MAKRLHLLPSASWVNGGNIQIPLKGIPALARVSAFIFRLEADFLTGAAAALIAGSQLPRLFQMIDIGGFARGSGSMFRFLDWHLHGANRRVDASIPATNASHFMRNITIVVPFSDTRCIEQFDDVKSGAELNDVTISIDTAAAASLDVATDWNTLNAATPVTGTLRAYAVLEEANDAPGALVKLGFADLTGQSPVLDSGLYTDLFLYRENCGTISNVQVATVAAQADGSQLFDQMKLGELAAWYNERYSLGGVDQVDSATAPVAGERIQDTPVFTAGQVTTITVPFLPIFAPSPTGYKKTQAVRVEDSLRLDFTGTDTTFRVGYRKILARSESDAVNAFRRLGRGDIVSAAQIAPKTASKRSLSGPKAHWARYFPLRALQSRG